MKAITVVGNLTVSMMSDDRTVQIRVKRWLLPQSAFAKSTSRLSEPACSSRQ